MKLSLVNVCRLLGIGWVLSVSTTISAQKLVPAESVQIKGLSYHLPENSSGWIDSMEGANAGFPQLVVMQFQSLPSTERLTVLENNGICLNRYLSGNAYLTLIRSIPPRRILDEAGVRSIIVFETDWKIDDRLKMKLSAHPQERMKVLASFLTAPGLADISLLLSSVNARITDRRFAPADVYEIEIPAADIRELSKNPLVKYLSLPAEIQPLNRDARASAGASLLQSPAFGLDGSGVTVGVGDNTSAIFHVDARDRLINFNPEPATFHGIHTTLTTAGKGIMDPRARGMAPSANILGHLYDIVWAQTPYMLQDYNMTLTNNSYAAIVNDCVYAGTYDQYSEMLDQYALQYPTVLNVFAAGNDGPNTCPPFPPSFHTVTGGYQAAKNVLVVGATRKDNVIWPKSSRGPVKDGRLKPEVVAFGFDIYSGDIFDQYGGSNGTSMSCPVTTGNIALLEQRYKLLHAGQNAPAALLKALVMNGAIDLGNPGPDYTFGFGQLNTYRSLQMLNNSQYLSDSLNNSSQKTHTINVPANTAQLKMMLYWNDVPGTALAPNALINDLDAELAGPGGAVHRPLILNGSATNVNDNAVEGVDSKNNVEQIIINNPSQGSYSAKIKGTNIPAGKQSYWVVFDLVPNAIKLKFPTAGVPVPAEDTLRIYWDAPEGSNSFTLEYSDNGGSSWNVLDNSIPADQRHFYWGVPNISSAQALVKISRNNTSLSDVSGLFTINPQPLAQLDAVQCPGYIAIGWNSIANATAYEISRKIGKDLVPVDTVTATGYTFSGLFPDSLYYVAVTPLVNGVRGYRSKSVRRMPNDGTCAGSISNADLMIASVIAPHSGRRQTSSALTNNETLSLSIRNLDDAPSGNYRVSYSLNGSAWQSQTVATPIPAGGVTTVDFSGLALANPGVYQIRAAVEHLGQTDPVTANDSLVFYFRQLSNGSINLNSGFDDDFEALPLLTVLRDSLGISPNEHWDFVNSSDSGRLRSLVSSDVTISGQRSLSMDVLYNLPDIQNYLEGTFNLSGYSAAGTEARAEFNYKIHGRPKFLAGNEVWVRGADTDPWVGIYIFDTSAIPGQINHTGSLSITDALLNAGQDFSSSFQVRIGQHDTSVIAMNEYGNGLTIDDFRLYSVKNDVQLLAVRNPPKLGCGLGSATPLQVLIYNSDNLPQNDIQLYYRLDNGQVVTEVLDSLAAKDSILYTFNQAMNVSAVGSHVLDVWLQAAGDTYLPNDSILNYQFRNQPLVASFPYLENFETGNGSWFTDGQNDSWEYGTPASLRIDKAASGTKAWKTNLTGNYNDNEESFLYSPCFDLSGLSKPMLSFSISTDIEHCGSSICDLAYLEYSSDGLVWSKLGAFGEGTNWYDDIQAWRDTSTRWRVASIPLPSGLSSLKLRFVFQSDAGTAREGIAVDDVHIFDRTYPIYEGGTLKLAQTAGGSGWVDFSDNGSLLGQLNARGGNLGNTEFAVYAHALSFNPIVRQYSLPRNYVINSASAPSDSVDLRLYITDMEVISMVADQSCLACQKAGDAYRLGITKYDDADPDKENGSLSDNKTGSYSFIPYTRIKWVPYDKGYYAETVLGSFSELWFNTGIPEQQQTIALVYPNPADGGSLNIIWNAQPGTQMQLLIADMLGRVVYRNTAVATDYDNLTSLMLPSMQTGVYILRYIAGAETQEVKLIIR